MVKRVLIVMHLAGVTAANLAGQTRPAVTAEGEFSRIVQAFLAKEFSSDWEGAQKLPVIRWTGTPSELQNCLPDGNCYAWQGVASIGGRNIAAIAAGARTIISALYLRNAGAGIGETTVLGALKAAGFNSELARCPAAGQAGSTNWYKLRSTKANSGVLSIQTSCNGAACEGFVLTQGEDLPALQPNQVKLYSEQCGAGSDRKPISTLLPHELFAKSLAAFIPAATATVPYDWKALASIQGGGVQWQTGGPKRIDLSYRGDPNPFSLSGSASYAGRVYSPMASGSQTQVLTVYFEESRLHPAGENVLSVLRADGFTVQLVRCGPVYTESTQNYYRVTSARTKPVVLKQGIRKDGNQFQDSYDLRLDNSLPTRDARDRDPGVSGCQ